MANASEPHTPKLLTEAELARHYRWLNLHPASEAQAIRTWFQTSQAKFQAARQVYPLVLQGEPSSGRSYLLEAAYFQQKHQGWPVIIFHWDMEVWDAPTREQQIEHLQARLDDFVQQIHLNNPSLYGKLSKILPQVENVALPVGVEFSVNLKGLWEWLLPPPRNRTSATDAQDRFAAVKERFRQLLQDSHVILHIQHAELLDQGLLAHLWTLVKYLNAEQETEQSFMGLAFSFPSAHPVGELLGSRERYAVQSLQSFSKGRVTQALHDIYGAEVAKHEAVKWLLQHAALTNGQLDANAVSRLLNTLLDQGLLDYSATQQQWFLAASADLNQWQQALGQTLEQRWNSCMDQVAPATRSRLQTFFSLAALGGEWIPVNLLLDYLEISETDTRDTLIDALDETFAEFLHCADWKFVGVEGLVYLFKSPLLPTLLLDPATKQTQASALIKWLQQRCGKV
ncbi:MAG TPA: hypothetical protein PLM98_12320, partial [Thiolinea sp.]|nr:hypothetical protein [Thiolinea sp.]